MKVKIKNLNLAKWAFILFLFAPAYARFYQILNLGEHTPNIGAAYPMILGTFGIWLSAIFLMPALIMPSAITQYGDYIYFAVMVLFYVVGFIVSLRLWRKSIKKEREGLNIASGWVSLGYCLFTVPYALFYLFSPTSGGVYTKVYFTLFLLVVVLFTVVAIIRTKAYLEQKQEVK